MQPIDISFKNSKQPVCGSILISDPFLDEDYFRRSVVLLCSHENSDGSFGLVLNNFVKLDLHEIEHSFPDINARISIGGPVDTEFLFFIHTYGELVEEATLIKGNLYFGGNYNDLREQILKDDDPEKNVRFFLGYSGWSAGQLKNELKENSWVVADNITEEEILATDNNNFWQFCLTKQGKVFETISKFPLNPNDN
ncbi:MAG: YqgE/AlgH family protein [Bacteroidota bacterium]